MDSRNYCFFKLHLVTSFDLFALKGPQIIGVVIAIGPKKLLDIQTNKDINRLRQNYSRCVMHILEDGGRVRFWLPEWTSKYKKGDP